MGMKSPRAVVLPVAAGIILAIVLELIGVRWGPALITGAIVAIGVSILMQRRIGPGDGGSASTSGATSAADIDALLATAHSSVTGFTAAVAEIGNPSTREIAEKIGTNLAAIMTELQQPEKRAAAPVVVDNLIEPAQSVLTEYLFLTRKAIAAATPRATTIEQRIIPQIESASRQTLALLREPGKPDLARITRASTVPFEQAVTIPPGGATPKGSRQIKP